MSINMSKPVDAVSRTASTVACVRTDPRLVPAAAGLEARIYIPIGSGAFPVVVYINAGRP
jgi:hypothetical protein